MVCDDDLASFAGSVLVSAEVADAPSVADEDGDVREVKFVRVATTSGTIVVSSHNQHNGYYGGFEIVEVTP